MHSGFTAGRPGREGDSAETGELVTGEEADPALGAETLTLSSDRCAKEVTKGDSTVRGGARKTGRLHPMILTLRKPKRDNLHSGEPWLRPTLFSAVD